MPLQNVYTNILNPIIISNPKLRLLRPIERSNGRDCVCASIKPFNLQGFLKSGKIMNSTSNFYVQHIYKFTSICYTLTLVCHQSFNLFIILTCLSYYEEVHIILSYAGHVHMHTHQQ